MKKIAILNYFDKSISVITISPKLLEEYNNDIENILIENSTLYIKSVCYWVELNLDLFSNFNVNFELLDERKS